MQLVVGVPADDAVASIFPHDRSRVHPVRESAVLGRLAVGRGFQRQLAGLVQNGRTVIHDHGLWLPSNRAAARFADRRHVPRVVSPRGMLSDWALQHHSWKKKLVWRLFQQHALQTAAGFHITSQQEAEEVRQVGLTQPVAVIPNGLDLPREMPARKRVGPPQALFLSRVHRKKGIVELLRGWSAAANAGDPSPQPSPLGRGEGAGADWQLVIAGPDEGGYLAEVKAEVKRLGLQDAVSFAGPVDDNAKWQLYADADLFVLPSLSENFGIVVAEAMAAGLPVITTTGTPWQVLRDQQMGWWVEPQADMLAQALRDARARSPEQLREMGRRASEYARREFSWERVARELIGFYGEVLGS